MLASVCSGGFAEPIGSIAVIELKGTGGTVIRTLFRSGSWAFSFSVSISHPGRCVEYAYPVPDCVGVFCCDDGEGGEEFAGAESGLVFSIGADAELGAGGRGLGAAGSAGTCVSPKENSC